MANRIVICQNDYPVEVCAEGTTELTAEMRCRQLKEAKLLELSKQGHTNKMVYFHWHELPVWNPAGAEKPLDASDPKEVDKFIGKLEGLIDARIEWKTRGLQGTRHARDSVNKARNALREFLIKGLK